MIADKPWAYADTTDAFGHTLLVRPVEASTYDGTIPVVSLSVRVNGDASDSEPIVYVRTEDIDQLLEAVRSAAGGTASLKTAPQTPGRDQGTCGAPLWQRSCTLRPDHTGDHGIRHHGACTNCGHVMCEGGRPCGALLRVSAVSDHRCACTEGAPSIPAREATSAPQTPGREQEIRARAELTATLYDSIAAFNAVACWDILRLAQMRQYLAEDLAQTVSADRDAAVAAAVRCALEDFASRLTARAASMGATHFRVDQVADAARRIAAEEHGPSVASPAREQGEADRVVAYRNSERPSFLLCREHGDGWVGLTPLTAEDLPDGGICTWGRPDGPECGRDVLITPASEQGGDAR